MNRLLLFFIVFSSQVNAQEIAITFDDAPTPDGLVFSGEERTRRIIGHLQDNRIKEVAFFVLTGNINAKTASRLTAYSNAGYLLANHSHSHHWIHEHGVDAYLRDVRTADSILRYYPAYVKWFRYPFLDEGKSVAVRDSIRAGLKKFDLFNGYVTVDNYDWYLNHLLQQAKENHKIIHQEILREVYLDHIYSSILFYDKIARDQLGRSPKHVLLLHESDLTALFLGDLIRHLQAKGWKIISPRDAYKDPVAEQLPDVLFNGQGRVAAMARARGIAARDLVQQSEDEAYLDELVKRRNVFE